jgi:hypothetical protein
VKALVLFMMIISTIFSIIAITELQQNVYAGKDTPKGLCKDYDGTWNDGKCKFENSDDEVDFDHRLEDKGLYDDYAKDKQEEDSDKIVEENIEELAKEVAKSPPLNNFPIRQVPVDNFEEIEELEEQQGGESEELEPLTVEEGGIQLDEGEEEKGSLDNVETEEESNEVEEEREEIEDDEPTEQEEDEEEEEQEEE